MPVFTVKELKEWDVSTELEPGKYVPCRPLGGPFIWRLKAAWQVLTGRYDALDWGPGQRGEDELSEEPEGSFISRGL